MTEQAPQSEGDLIDLITKDHREVERAFSDYEKGNLSGQQRRDLVDHIITELVRHAVAEEQYLYPTARENLSDGDRVADKELQEHAEAEMTMKQLENLDTTDAAFDSTMRKLIGDIRHHIHDEENDLLPRLRYTCSSEQLQDLGTKISRAKQSAPTRPHPSAPDRPPANMILDPGAGMIDRMRDALFGRQH